MKTVASRGLAVLLATCNLLEAATDSANHWALQPLRSPPVPQVAAPQSIHSPVDNFILARLEERGLEAAPLADRRTLLRRVTFDLTGLPPTPAEMTAYLADARPDAYERVVTRLLASPGYGERWARHWMDAAHFAETHGHDQDRIRTNAWRYRDYLVGAFNEDKPYGRFVEEQLAGDVLFPDDPLATVAVGFLAAGPWDESSLRDIREDSLDRQIGRYLDRDDMVTTVMSVFTSTTVHCARCHDHKFDPIPQRDYYALQAVFAGVERANRVFDSDPGVHRRRQELLAMRRQVERGNREWLRGLSAQRAVEQWERHRVERPVKWQPLVPEAVAATDGSILMKRDDGSVVAGGPRPERDTYTIRVRSPLATITAVRLETLPDDGLPHRGPGRQDNGNFHLSEVRLLVAGPDERLHEVPLAHPSADFNQAQWTIEHALDRNEETAWGIYPRVGEPHQAVFELREPLRPGPAAMLVVELKQLHGGGHLIGRARLTATDAPTPVRADVLPTDIAVALQVPPAARSMDQRAALATFVLRDNIRHELARLPPPSLTYAVASDFEPDGGLKPVPEPRVVEVLRRGEITQPIEAAAPGALACVPALSARFAVAQPGDEGVRRAALAAWLTDSHNPLTWRSIVNRIWHYHFGRGLVDTPNDFGRLGSPPSHPELLDWLAVWFRDEARGSLKALHQLLVTSAAYQRSAAGPEEDAANLLWSRFGAARLDAEQVRDAVLQVVGRLDRRMGGPSDMQFDLQPGIHVTPRVDYDKFDLDSHGGNRRGVYRFLFRTIPDPFMDALDCPAGDQLTATRQSNVTVQQSLTMWNGAFISHHAEHFATRLEREAAGTDAQVRLACELVWSRAPTPSEANALGSYAAKHGLANLCRLLLNSSEFMFVD